MSEKQEHDLLQSVVELYERMKMEEIFLFPSSSIQVTYQKRVRRSSRGVFHKLHASGIELTVFGKDYDDALDVIASFFANYRLKASPHFGTRHGALLYFIPVIALFILLLAVAIGGMVQSEYGITLGIIAAVINPFLIFWVGRSLTRRRNELKENLAATGRFDSPEEIEDIVAWLGTKNHTWGYWFSRGMIYESVYIGLAFLYYMLSTLKS